MYEYLLIMVRMIAFSYKYSEESGYSLDLDKPHGVSPQEAMWELFESRK